MYFFTTGNADERIINLMAETSFFCKMTSLDTHRDSIVSKMMYISSNVDCINRSCLSLAIPIFDKYECMCPEAIPSLFTLPEDHWLIALACLGLAFKFQHGDKFKYTPLLKATPTLLESDENIAKILKLEMVVFEGIKWKIPVRTAFELL